MKWIEGVVAIFLIVFLVVMGCEIHEALQVGN